MAFLSNLSPEQLRRIEQVFIERESKERQEAEQERKRKSESTPKPQTPAQSPVISPVVQPSNVVITPSSDYWTIEGVKYRKQSENVQLSKELIDNRTSKTQDNWATYSTEAMKQGQFHTPDYPLFYNVLKAVKSKTTPESEEIKAKIREFSRANWLMTLTRITYASKGLDEIVHMHGTSNPYSEKVNFVGTDGLIKDKTDTPVYQKLLGTEDSIQEINDTFKWLNGTDTYVWRVNSKPSKLDERVAGFDAGSDWAGLGCGGGPSDSDASLGVRLVAKNFGGKP